MAFTDLYQILEREDVGFSNLAGVISLVAGFCMWVTALPGVRTWNFELFFYTHQLYVVFILFLAFHVSDFVVGKAAGGIFLFMLGRFLRFCQSRRTVNVISAKCLSKPGTVIMAAMASFQCFIQSFGWEISSICSHKELRGSIMNISEAEVAELQDQPPKPHSKITVSVEGPYGHAVPYHLMYESLILVAGGIGISPFLAKSSVIFSIELMKEDPVYQKGFWKTGKMGKVLKGQSTKIVNLLEQNHAGSIIIQYGSRPDFREIFGSVSRHWGYVDVGVIICGPPGFEPSVAREIRSQNLRRDLVTRFSISTAIALNLLEAKLQASPCGPFLFWLMDHLELSLLLNSFGYLSLWSLFTGLLILIYQTSLEILSDWHYDASREKTQCLSLLANFKRSY
ncbi:ferric-chelate reductase, putative [Ricinus communis]|uniref:Ferric-chelate reductase, putative n=1 Tax=Ricinus communis TaxID=3988 RepID=B9S074_RICCO|nr:ferric-chelate reductase, putative [Ricinus communis]